MPIFRKHVVYLYFITQYIRMKTKNNTEFIQIRIPKDMKLKVESLAIKAGLTTSAFIKSLINNAINS